MPEAVARARGRTADARPTTQLVYEEMTQEPALQVLLRVLTDEIERQMQRGACAGIKAKDYPDGFLRERAEAQAWATHQDSIATVVQDYFGQLRPIRGRWRNWYNLEHKWIHVTLMTAQEARALALCHTGRIEGLSTKAGHLLRLAVLLEACNDAPADIDVLLEEAASS